MQAVGPQRALVLGDDAASMSWAFVAEPVGDRDDVAGLDLLKRRDDPGPRSPAGAPAPVLDKPGPCGGERGS